MDRDLYETLAAYHRADQFFWTGTLFIGYPRYGSNKVWKFSDLELMGGSPDLTQRTTKTFGEIHDQRAIDMANKISATGQRLAVFWSGGIDSTTMLSAIVKNFPRSILQQVDVYLNNCSYYENPYFYHRVIKDKINHVNVNTIDNQGIQNLVRDSLVTDGEPADKLWLVEVGLSYLQIHGRGGLEQELSKGIDQFLSFLQNFMTEPQARVYWNHIEENIREVKAPVTTIADLFWWINFNYHWKGHLIGCYARHRTKNPEAWQTYLKNYHPWYCTPDFQIWSYSPVSQQRSFIDTMSQYKMEAKRYIYELDHNDFYLRYKTKLDSARRGASSLSGLVIFDDGTCVENAAQLTDFVTRYCVL